MSKLVVSLDSLGKGGAARVLSILSSPFSNCFDEVIYVFWNGSDTFYSYDSRIRIVSIQEQTSRKNRLSKMLYFRHLILSEKPDLVLSFLTPLNIMVLLSLVGISQKVIVAERTDPKRVFAGSKVVLWLRNLLYRKACGILTQTQYAKSCYKGKLNSKTIVIPNPVMLTENLIGSALHAEKQKLMITAGRLEKVKNQSMMIEAFGRFYETHKNYYLMICGGGPLKSLLEKQIDDLGLKDRVLLKGNVGNVWDLMASAEVFLLTSFYEGMSNSLLEAMCLGLPVISTNVGGVSEFIQSGNNGYLIDINDISKLTELMTLLADNEELRNRIGAKASKIYSVIRADSICKQWIEYLKSKI